MALLLGAGLATSQPAAATAPSEQQLLERHRPLLRYDAEEEYFAQPANRPAHPRPVDIDRVYGRVGEQDGRTWLQYWLFFAENTQDRGIFRTGRHEGDWELVQVGLGPEGEAEEVTFSQHSSAERCTASEPEVEILDWNGKAPVVYVANGSHALYPHAGVSDRPFPDPNDEHDGAGRFTRPDLWLGLHPDADWIAYEGRWGGSRASFIPGEQSSPLGPPFQESGAWGRPGDYAADARPCGAAPPGPRWALPVAVGFLAMALLAVAFVAGRVRGR